ncbi:prepronociceptin [Tachysurus fulvidraco]|uniref:prepronociceptin n=1 Tax=Tachysurus fulvidraco TaxID=1234273 RepID=UPI001FEEB4B4|nr:prepronociceptin [Tachysurus fulvidraco]
MMKTPFWTLLLMGLFVPGRGDCQKDCVSCSQILPKDHSFDTLVCLVECRSRVDMGLTWERCQSTLEEKPLTSLSVGNSVLKRAEEEVETVLPVGQSDGGLTYSGTLQRFDHVARALGLDELNQETEIPKFSPLSVQPPSAQEEPDAEDWELRSDRDGGPTVNRSKRFGGFLKSKYGYRKFMDPGRSLQKRYGGFIGIRKSARKWNTQKRFSEFLKQYLGMTTRASEFNSVSNDITRQNEV